MPAFAARILAPPLLESDDLRAPFLFEHLADHLGTVEERRSEARHAIAADHQHFGELDLCARIARHLLDVEHSIGSNAILLAAGLDDCVHVQPHGEITPFGAGRARAGSRSSPRLEIYMREPRGVVNEGPVAAVCQFDIARGERPMPVGSTDKWGNKCARPRTK